MPALANPQGLWLLSLLAPLVALYILKVRRERVIVASTWLWQAAARDMLARSPWQRLRGRLLLVLDVSASMQAEQLVDHQAKTRFALAQQQAERVLSGLPPGADVLLVEAGA